jgi:hypothetical protein
MTAPPDRGRQDASPHHMRGDRHGPGRTGTRRSRHRQHFVSRDWGTGAALGVLGPEMSKLTWRVGPVSLEAFTGMRVVAHALTGGSGSWGTVPKVVTDNVRTPESTPSRKPQKHRLKVAVPIIAIYKHDAFPGWQQV